MLAPAQVWFFEGKSIVERSQHGLGGGDGVVPQKEGVEIMFFLLEDEQWCSRMCVFAISELTVAKKKEKTWTKHENFNVYDWKNDQIHWKHNKSLSRIKKCPLKKLRIHHSINLPFGIFKIVHKYAKIFRVHFLNKKNTFFVNNNIETPILLIVGKHECFRCGLKKPTQLPTLGAIVFVYNMGYSLLLGHRVKNMKFLKKNEKMNPRYFCIFTINFKYPLGQIYAMMYAQLL